MKYRSRSDIIQDIFKSIEDHNGAIKTHIMYEAKLSFPQMKEYLLLLAARGLITYSDDRKYILTKAGKDFKRKLAGVNQMLEIA